MFVPDDGPRLGSAPERPEGAKWAEPLRIIDAVTYRADGAGYFKPGYTQLFWVPADGGAPATRRDQRRRSHLLDSRQPLGAVRRQPVGQLAARPNEAEIYRSRSTAARPPR